MGWGVMNWIVLLRKGRGGGCFERVNETSGTIKRGVISWKAEDRLASQVGMCSVEVYVREYEDFSLEQ